MGEQAASEGPARSPVRIGRLAAELRMRRRRLNAYRRSPPWPGKEPSLRFELVRYDAYLVLAAEMLHVTAPEFDGTPLAPETRALLEDRLAHAGLDVLATMRGTGDVLQHGDLFP